VGHRAGLENTRKLYGWFDIQTLDIILTLTILYVSVPGENIW